MRRVVHKRQSGSCRFRGTCNFLRPCKVLERQGYLVANLCKCMVSFHKIADAHCHPQLDELKLDDVAGLKVGLLDVLIKLFTISASFLFVTMVAEPAVLRVVSGSVWMLCTRTIVVDGHVRYVDRGTPVLFPLRFSAYQNVKYKFGAKMTRFFTLHQLFHSLFQRMHRFS